MQIPKWSDLSQLPQLCGLTSLGFGSGSGCGRGERGCLLFSALRRTLLVSPSLHCHGCFFLLMSFGVLRACKSPSVPFPIQLTSGGLVTELDALGCRAHVQIAVGRDSVLEVGTAWLALVSKPSENHTGNLSHS